MSKIVSVIVFWSNQNDLYVIIDLMSAVTNKASKVVGSKDFSSLNRRWYSLLFRQNSDLRVNTIPVHVSQLKYSVVVCAIFISVASVKNTMVVYTDAVAIFHLIPE